MAKNPYHIDAFIERSWVCTQSFLPFAKHYLKNPSTNNLTNNDGPQTKASSQTAIASTAAKGKKVTTGARVLQTSIPQIQMLFSINLMKNLCLYDYP